MLAYLIIFSILSLNTTFLCSENIDQNTKNNSTSSNRQTVDKMLVTVYTSEAVIPVSQSNLRPGIDGAPRDLKTVVFDHLLLNDGKKLKIVKPDDDPEQKEEDSKYLNKILKARKLNHQDIVNLFSEMGYSYEEGLRELRNIRLKDTIFSSRVRGKVFVDKKDIEKYCADNPKFHPTVYVLSETEVKLNPNLPKKEQKEALDKLDNKIKTGEILHTATWGDNIEIKETDIDAKFEEVKKLPVSGIIKTEITDSAVKLLRLADKKAACPVSIEERSKEVNHILSKDKFEKVLDKYQKDLWKTSHIKYMPGVNKITDFDVKLDNY